jgi:hypothetical protein
MINSSLHQNIIAAEGGWIVTYGMHIKLLDYQLFVANPSKKS